MRDLLSEPRRKSPRPHQVKSVEMIRHSLARGNRRVVLQLPTGAGKTFLASMIADMALTKGNRVMFTVPALSLIDQTVEAFRGEGIDDIGVIQANHPMTNYTAQVQIASVQTLARRMSIPKAALVIVDECHVRSKAITALMERWPEVVFVGLTATPWAAGMGDEWQDLVIGTTMADLICEGYLSDFRVFAPSHPDLSNVKITGGDYNSKGLAGVMDEGEMVGDVVETWLRQGENRPTLCFGVNRAHAKHLQMRFQGSGIACGYIDAHTDSIERAYVKRKFEAGEFRVVCNVGCLTTGVDWDVRCIILARPTRSEMLYVQMIGRGLRMADGKDDCLIFDHSDNTLRLGLVTDIHHDRLKVGHDKREPQRRSEALPKECSKCGFVKPPKTRKCANCGHEADPPKGDVDTIDGELAEVDRGNSSKIYTREEKQAFWSGLLHIAGQRDRKRGWASHAYRERFGVWPTGLSDMPSVPAATVVNFVKSKDIAYAKWRAKNAV